MKLIKDEKVVTVAGMNPRGAIQAIYKQIICLMKTGVNNVILDNLSDDRCIVTVAFMELGDLCFIIVIANYADIPRRFVQLSLLQMSTSRELNGNKQQRNWD